GDQQQALARSLDPVWVSVERGQWEAGRPDPPPELAQARAAAEKLAQVAASEAAIKAVLTAATYRVDEEMRSAVAAATARAFAARELLPHVGDRRAELELAALIDAAVDRLAAIEPAIRQPAAELPTAADLRKARQTAKQRRLAVERAIAALDLVAGSVQAAAVGTRRLQLAQADELARRARRLLPGLSGQAAGVQAALRRLGDARLALGPVPGLDGRETASFGRAMHQMTAAMQRLGAAVTEATRGQAGAPADAGHGLDLARGGETAEDAPPPGPELTMATDPGGAGDAGQPGPANAVTPPGQKPRVPGGGSRLADHGGLAPLGPGPGRQDADQAEWADLAAAEPPEPESSGLQQQHSGAAHPQGERPQAPGPVPALPASEPARDATPPPSPAGQAAGSPRPASPAPDAQRRPDEDTARSASAASLPPDPAGPGARAGAHDDPGAMPGGTGLDDERSDTEDNADAAVPGLADPAVDGRSPEFALADNLAPEQFAHVREALGAEVVEPLAVTLIPAASADPFAGLPAKAVAVRSSDGAYMTVPSGIGVIDGMASPRFFTAGGDPLGRFSVEGVRVTGSQLYVFAGRNETDGAVRQAGYAVIWYLAAHTSAPRLVFGEVGDPWVASKLVELGMTSDVLELSDEMTGDTETVRAAAAAAARAQGWILREDMPGPPGTAAEASGTDAPPGDTDHPEGAAGIAALEARFGPADDSTAGDDSAAGDDSDASADPFAGLPAQAVAVRSSDGAYMTVPSGIGVVDGMENPQFFNASGAPLGLFRVLEPRITDDAVYVLGFRNQTEGAIRRATYLIVWYLTAHAVVPQLVIEAVGDPGLIHVLEGLGLARDNFELFSDMAGDTGTVRAAAAAAAREQGWILREDMPGPRETDHPEGAAGIAALEARFGPADDSTAGDDSAAG
ncbi:MAG TPA: hypothetical protein VK586_27605, partial [Streptosporangiaceae bacterium]|nr:hypothetical protein [Streptosporangiaceae bacterium]